MRNSKTLRCKNCLSRRVCNGDTLTRADSYGRRFAQLIAVSNWDTARKLVDEARAEVAEHERPLPNEQILQTTLAEVFAEEPRLVSILAKSHFVIVADVIDKTEKELRRYPEIGDLTAEFVMRELFLYLRRHEKRTNRD